MLISGEINFHISKQQEIFLVIVRMKKCLKKITKEKLLKSNTHAVPVIGQPTALHAEQFAKLTGAKVDVTTYTLAGDLDAKTYGSF
jgi:hypothetical protein